MTVGDMNRDILQVPPPLQVERYFAVLYEAEFVAGIEEVTRAWEVTRSASGSCLDHVFIKLINHVRVC